jgi:hypothetical protein
MQLLRSLQKLLHTDYTMPTCTRHHEIASLFTKALAYRLYADLYQTTHAVYILKVCILENLHNFPILQSIRLYIISYKYYCYHCKVFILIKLILYSFLNAHYSLSAN